tara:strand:+ start:712 stop:939 length:228 start_codon:yes stop_codon:yes gene_type:complete
MGGIAMTCSDFKMIRLLKIFKKADSGAVTVDWVVLTAAVVGLAFAAFASISGGTDSVGTATSDMLTTIEAGAFGD